VFLGQDGALSQKSLLKSIGTQQERFFTMKLARLLGGKMDFACGPSTGLG